MLDERSATGKVALSMKKVTLCSLIHSSIVVSVVYSAGLDDQLSVEEILFIYLFLKM